MPMPSQIQWAVAPERYGLVLAYSHDGKSDICSWMMRLWGADAELTRTSDPLVDDVFARMLPREGLTRVAGRVETPGIDFSAEYVTTDGGCIRQAIVPHSEGSCVMRSKYDSITLVEYLGHVAMAERSVGNVKWLLAPIVSLLNPRGSFCVVEYATSYSDCFVSFAGRRASGRPEISDRLPEEGYRALLGSAGLDTGRAWEYERLQLDFSAIARRAGEKISVPFGKPDDHGLVFLRTEAR